MYIDALTLRQALADLKGTANHMIKIWFVLKVMGLRKSSPVEIDTKNSKTALDMLFKSGDPAGSYYIPFFDSPRWSTIKSSASRSIIQTNIQKWMNNKIVGCDPTAYLKISKLKSRYKIAVSSDYPNGLGKGKNGFAKSEDENTSIPLLQFAIWMFVRDEIPDGTTNVERYLIGRLRRTLHLSEEEERRVFARCRISIGMQDQRLSEQEIWTLCDVEEKGNDEQEAGECEVEDVLGKALRLFMIMRLTNEWTMMLRRDGYEGLRKRYENMNPASLREMSAAEFDTWCEKEVWSAQHFRCRDTLKKLSDGQKRLCAEFIAATKKNVQLISHYFPTKERCPEGFGPAVVTELLMKFHPLDYIGYNQLMLEGMKVLNLKEGEFKYDDALGYQKFLGVATVILDKMVQMKLPRSFEEDERSKPDFITVNEFLWWCKVNAGLIKEEIDMNNINSLKRVEETPTYEAGAKGLEAFGEDEMLKRLAAALKTKPFAILAGHSGTGKSQLVRRLAHMTCNVESLRKEADDTTLPGNYCMVQVKPNWHDSNDLLGYYSDMNGRHYRTTPFVEFICKAYAYPDTPFFVCLDEMNLAPVEHYFAEYLSAIESADIKGGVYVTDPVVTIDSSAGADGKKKRDGAIAMEMMGSQASANAADWIMTHDLTLPKNLFVVGTVNMDETTQQFSRKVLDRAMTILMDRVDFASMKKPEMPTCMNEEAVKFFLGHSVKTDALKPEQASLLGDVNEVLKNTSFVVAYRFANEYALYQEAIEQIDPSGKDEVGKARLALDHMVMMKLLPRIHGERKDVAAIFGNEDGRDGLRKIVGSDGLSGVQMTSILGRGGDYLTFWP